MGRRPSYLPKKTEEQLRAERKARRDRRKLWKTDPDKARKLTREEWDAQDAKYEAAMKPHRERIAAVKALLPKYVAFSFFKFSNKYNQEQEGGKLTCKVCGKTFQWTEWGRAQTAGLTRMGEHLWEHHPQEFKALGCFTAPRFEMKDWMEDLYKKMKKEGTW